MQLSACNPRGCSSSCTSTLWQQCRQLTAATTATTVAAIAVTTSIKQLRPLQLLRLLQLRLLAHQPYVATPATPSWHTSMVSTLMACTGGSVHYGYMQRLLLLPLHLAAHKAGANCKLQTASCKLQTANCKLQAVLLWHRICNSHNSSY